MNVSIVTPTFNSAETIRHTLESVNKQTHPDIEHIIIDGGSTDETLELVERYGKRVKLIISEPDDGIYDAMNKGVAAATGDVVGILNSDDYYTHREVVQRLMHRMEEETADSVFADLQYVQIDEGVQVRRHWRAGEFHRRKFLYGWMPPHPTFFVRRELYDKYGLFDAGFDISGDYELMLRFLYRYEISTCYLPEVVVRMRVGGNSNGGFATRLKANREDRLAWEMNDLDFPFYTPILKPFRKIQQYRFSIASILVG